MFVAKARRKDWLRLLSVTAGSLALVALGRVVTLADGSHKVLTWILWSMGALVLALLALILWRATRKPKHEDEELTAPVIDKRTNAAQETRGDHSPAVQFQHSQVTINAPSSAGTGEPNAEVTFDRALANALTELGAIDLRLQRAEESGHLAQLPADHHQPIADLLTDKGFHSSREALDAAYNACDALQHRLREPSRRWEGGPMPEMKMPVVEEADDVAGVIAAVTAAIEELRDLQRQAGPSPRGEDAELQFGSVEVADPRHINEPNVFHESWQGCPVTFNLINPQGGARARSVRPTVTVTDPEGKVLAGPANARWANPQPPNSEEVERDIPANGAPVAIDTVIQAVGGEKFWLVTDEGLRKGLKGGTAAIVAQDILVTVSVQGENFPPTTETVRVRLGFPKPALGDEEPSDTLLPPGEGDEQRRVEAPEDEDPVEPEPPRLQQPAPSRTHGQLDKLYVEGTRMLKAADPITSVAGSILYGPAPSEAQIDRWQARVREALPRPYKRRFRFAPLEARAATFPLIQTIKPFESEKTRRLRESLAELKRIMIDMDDE